METDLDTLNRQAIDTARQYAGEFAWPTVVFTVCVVAAFVGNLVAFSHGLMPFWLALLVYAVLTYFSYTPLHEAAHGNIHGQHGKLKWVNDLCGYLVAPIIAVPYASHTAEHFTHHRYTNQAGKDPDFVVSGMRRGLLAFFACGIKFLWVQNSFLARNHWQKSKPKDRVIYFLELAISVGWRVAAAVLIAQQGVVALLLFGYLIGAFFTAYWFAYRPHLPYEEPARYRNTNSLLMPAWMKPLEWFWLGQNIHSIHHLFPRVPFYRYHALHRDIEPIMRAHGTPMIGLFSRAPA